MESCGKPLSVVRKNIPKNLYKPTFIVMHVGDVPSRPRHTSLRRENVF